jgi:hypothetical protein
MRTRGLDAQRVAEGGQVAEQRRQRVREPQHRHHRLSLLQYLSRQARSSSRKTRE